MSVAMSKSPKAFLKLVPGVHRFAEFIKGGGGVLCVCVVIHDVVCLCVCQFVGVFILQNHR